MTESEHAAIMKHHKRMIECQDKVEIKHLHPDAMTKSIEVDGGNVTLRDYIKSIKCARVNVIDRLGKSHNCQK